MRVVSEIIDSAVASTTSGDRLVAHAWRDGAVVAQDLIVSAFSLRWDAAQQVQGQASLTISDPSGHPAPISPDAALGWGGSRIQLSYVWGDSRIPPVPLGMWRIRKPTPKEFWRFYRGQTGTRVAGWGEGPWGQGPWGEGHSQPVREIVDGVPVGALLVHSGGSVRIEADEETASVDKARLDSEPVVEATSLDEIRRLLQDICSVTVHGSIEDRAVPSGLV